MKWFQFPEEYPDKNEQKRRLWSPVHTTCEGHFDEIGNGEGLVGLLICTLMSRGMRKRKLYHLLALIGPNDRQRFTLFLDSPYCNSSPILRLFWQQWQAKVFTLEKDQDISEIEFVQGTSLKVNRVNRLCSQLMQKAKEFLAYEDYQKQPSLQRVMFSTAILHRDPGMQTSKRFVPQVINELENEPESPERHLALLYLKAFVAWSKTRARITVPNWQDEFSELQVLLQEFWLSKGAQLACGAANANKIFKQQSPPAPEFSTFLKTALPQSESLLPRMYHLTFKLLEGEDAGDLFSELLGLLETHRNAIAEFTRNDLYSYLLNHCIRQINLGKSVFLHHAFSLYQQLLKNKDLLQDGKISPQQFKNITALASRIGHLDWVDAFIGEFQGKLSDSHHGMAIQYNQAVLLFHRRDYAQSIVRFREIIQVANHDVFYGLDARMYLWKSYFEHLAHLNAEEVDEMYRLYDAFRLYIDRNEKISALHQVQYRNFVRLFRRFMKLLEKESGTKRRTDLLAFQKKLATSEEVANKSWFESKVKEKILQA